jgi:hypothetical protein
MRHLAIAVLLAACGDSSQFRRPDADGRSAVMPATFDTPARR